MTRKLAVVLVMVVTMMVGVVGGSFTAPAEAGPPSSWGATIVRASRSFELQSCWNANVCPDFGHVNSGKILTDMCRTSGALGGTIDAVFHYVPGGPASATRVGFASTQSLSTGRTVNNCFAVRGTTFPDVGHELTLRSCPVGVLGACPASGLVDPGSPLRNLCFATIAGQRWDVVMNEQTTDIGFVASTNLRGTKTANSCI